MAGVCNNLDDLTIEELFVYFNQRPPKPEKRLTPKYLPKHTCFAYLPKSAAINDREKCMALKKLYCRYEEECRFYHQYELKGNFHGQESSGFDERDPE